MLFSDTYIVVTAPTEALFKDRGSKFFAYVFPVKTEAEVKEQLQFLRKKHFDARHHCYAYILGADKSGQRANDDGEPANTAGKPILGRLISRDLTNTLVVVVRYFGGTLLGVSGLINAYRTAAEEALMLAPTEECFVKERYKVEFMYPRMSDVMRWVNDNELDVLERSFLESCALEVAIRKSKSDELVRKISELHNVKCHFTGVC